MTDREQLCKEFTELTGGHWHEIYQYLNGYGCSCGFPVTSYYLDGEEVIKEGHTNPTYTNPTDVLKAVKTMYNYIGFLSWIGFFPQDGHEDASWIDEYIIKPDALLKAAVEFLKENKK